MSIAGLPAIGRRLVVAGVVVACVLHAGVARPEAVEVHAGVGGVRRGGAWTPVVVSAAADMLPAGTPVTIAVQDADGQFVRSPPAVVESDEAGRSTARFSARFGRPEAGIRFEASTGGTGPVSHVVEPAGSAAPAAGRMILVIGDLPAVARAARLADRDGDPATRVVTLSNPASTVAGGVTPRDYDAFDTAVVCGRAAAALPPETVAALEGWLARGGRLLLLAGSSAVTLTRSDCGAAAWLPGRAERMTPLKRLAPIESHARAAGLGDRVGGAGMAVPVLSPAIPDDGVIDCFAGDGQATLPLVVRRARGLGTVTWLGIDLDEARLANWPGGDNLLAGLLGSRNRLDSAVITAEPAGGGDLAAQLRAGLDRAVSSGRGAIPFEIVAGLGLLYALCLYPLDWWLVARGGRPWVAWLSLPLLAAGFVAAARAATTWRGVREDGCRTAEVIDVDAASGLVRGYTWAAVLATANGAIDVGLAAPQLTGTGGRLDLSDTDLAVSWFADAGPGFGGIDAAVPHPSLAAADYGYAGSLATLAAVPIAARSTRLFEAEWFAEADRPVVTATLRSSGPGTLAGELAHHLPFRLEGCRLLHEGWLYDVGTLAPDARFDPESGRGPRSLASDVTRRRATRERDAAVRWDPAETDVGRILEVAGLHAAAGGVAYTVVPAGRLRRLDLSPLLTVGRALLVGMAPADGRCGSAWHVGSASGPGSSPAPRPAAATPVRIVIPVATSAEAGR